jgi:hypothetical protein
MNEAALILVINVVSSLLKRWIYPRFGKNGVQVTIFILALIGAVYWTYGKDIVGIEQVVGTAIALFSMAVAIYEVILSRLNIFKQPELEGRDE